MVMRGGCNAADAGSTGAVQRAQWGREETLDTLQGALSPCSSSNYSGLFEKQ